MKCLLLIDPYRDTPEKCSWRKYSLLCLVFLIAGVIQGVHSQSEVLETENYGIIMSKNYPNNYPGKEEIYTWSIKVNSGNAVLHFRDFDVSSKFEGNCTRDYVEVIYSDDALPSINCGSDIPPPIHSKAANMTINFYVAGSSFSRGFYAEYISSESELVRPLVTVVNSETTTLSTLDCPIQDKLQDVSSVSLFRSADPGNSSHYTLLATNKGVANVSVSVEESNTTTYITDGSGTTNIRLTISQPTCSDAGVYKCVYEYASQNIPSTYETFRRVYFVYNPALSYITIYPEKKCHALKSEVVMDCGMTLGPDYMGLKQILQWESKLEDETEWGPHFGGHVIDDVKEPTATDRCLYDQMSNLNVVVTKEMSGRSFRCIVMTTGVEGDTPKLLKYEGSFNVIIREARDPYRPTKAVMTVTPEQTSYKPNSALRMKCVGSIGITGPGESPAAWQWEYRRYGIDDAWKTYTQAKDIVIGEAESANECDLTQATELTLTLTENENNVEFRCIVVKTKDNKEEKFERESASYHIKEVGDLSIGAASDELDINIIIGGSLGAALLIIAGVIIACYIWYIGRPKKKEARKPVPSPVTKVPTTWAQKAGVPAETRALDETAKIQRPSLTKKPEPGRKVSSSVDPPPRRPSTSVDPPGYGRR